MPIDGLSSRAARGLLMQEFVTEISNMGEFEPQTIFAYTEVDDEVSGDSGDDGDKDEDEDEVVDNRPIIKKTDEDYVAKYTQSRPESCPICMESYDNEDKGTTGPLDSDTFESRCNHWACNECWRTMSNEYQRRCYACRDNLEDWMDETYLAIPDESDADIEEAIRNMDLVQSEGGSVDVDTPTIFP